jgi:hypothetical protein
MQATAQKFTREIPLVQEINVETTEDSSCFEIRKKLDALFDGESRLEDAHAAIKRFLFGHLETCAACCRAFDVRARYRCGRGRGIF